MAKVKEKNKNRVKGEETKRKIKKKMKEVDKQAADLLPKTVRPRKTNRPLTAILPQHILFIKEYAKHLDPKKAAAKAGYKSKAAGRRLLAEPIIQEELETEIRRLLARHEVTQDRVLQEFAKLAFADIRQVLKWSKENGIEFKDSDDLDAFAAGGIASVTETTSRRGTKVKLKLHDKRGALDSLARYLGMFNDKLQLEGKGGFQLEVVDYAKDKEE